MHYRHCDTHDCEEAQPRMNAGSYLSSLARFVFAINLACTMTMIYIFNKLVELTLGWCTSKDFREQICLVCCGMAWKFTIFTSPWIRISSTKESKKNLAQFHADLKNAKPGDPGSMLICNHTSFFDTRIVHAVASCWFYDVETFSFHWVFVAQTLVHAVNACAYLPLDIMRRLHAYYSTHLDNIPVLGFVCKAVGHFPVKFKSDDYGKFSVDREAMKLTQVDTALMAKNFTHACTHRVEMSSTCSRVVQTKAHPFPSMAPPR